jgi:adenylate cyclase
MEYTAIGDSVNLSSRLEGACKIYGVSTLVSEFTVAALTQPLRLREIDLMRVKGRTQPVAVFETLAHHTPETFPNADDVLGHFANALAVYREREWSRAQTQFDAALAAHPQDIPSRIYRERCAHFATHPPDDKWDGVWTLKAK